MQPSCRLHPVRHRQREQQGGADGPCDEGDRFLSLQRVGEEAEELIAEQRDDGLRALCTETGRERGGGEG